MTEKDYAPLSSACVRGLCDKLYEKRKFAGVEIEKMVKDFNDANNSSQIKKLIRVLGQDLMSSTNPNVKNGALMGLSSVAVGLGKGSAAHLSELLHPMAACVREGESRVRYLAAEALFNVLKIARGDALPHFPLVFDALARLAADPEPQVRQGAELLDRLVKDIVTESGQLEVGALVPLLRERLYARGACARQFAAGWVAALDALPALPLLPHLRDLLDPLLHMLDEPHPEIRRMCEVQLNEFLRSIKKDPSQVDFQAMINILITHAQSPEELVQLTAISWIKEFVELAGRGMLPYASGVLCAALPCLAYADDARRINFLLTKLVAGVGEGAGGEQLQLEALVRVLTQLLRHSSVHTKVAALDWILHLYNTLPTQMPAHTEAVFGAVVGSLTDPADDVVRRALAVLAEICSCPAHPAHPEHPAHPAPAGDVESSPYYYKFLRALLRLLAADDGLLEDRGAFIIRQLCVLLNAEDIYKALASILVEETNLRFAATMVDVLSTMLLTAAELHHLRLQLRRMDQPGSAALLRALYRCWCHSPVALLALCLLTHHYAHCNTLIATFGDLDITVDFLTEVDKLVQLIESPIFAYLRLELLGGAHSPALRGALFGLLMLLPQSDAFHALRHRLHCAPLQPCLSSAGGAASSNEIDLEPLLAEFQHVQEAHRRYRLLERARPAPPAAAPAHR